MANTRHLTNDLDCALQTVNKYLKTWKSQKETSSCRTSGFEMTKMSFIMKIQGVGKLENENRNVCKMYTLYWFNNFF